MEETEGYRGKSNATEEEAEEEDIGSSGVFLELKQHCVQLLDLLQNSKKNHAFLTQLLQLLQRSPPQSLQPFLDAIAVVSIEKMNIIGGLAKRELVNVFKKVFGHWELVLVLIECFSYTLFPLLLLFDAAVNCRSSMKSDSKDNPLESNTLRTAHKVSDSVAEGVVLCLEEVLKKCQIGSVDQVIIEGIGIFNICLGKEFSSCGFLHSSLYMLLENVICSNFQVRRASDAVLHAISATQNCPTVGHLVLSNADYVIDSVCRQLRHLDLNPHVPNVLSAMLSYIGVADKILPLLEEPMQAVSMELEILGRHHHPNLTLSFLKAVAEIAKASRHEAYKLPNQAESYKKEINAKMMNTEKRTGKHFSGSYANDTDVEQMDSQTDGRISTSEADMQEEEWEAVLFKFNDSKRYRRLVGSIAGSCLVAVTPLIASADPAACLTALDVIEDGIMVLAKVEEAYKHESEMKEAIEQVIHSCSFHNLLDTLGAAEDETGESRLLPAMNKIWPFLVACFRSKNLVAIRKCTRTISTVVQICGGDFFSRRFHADGIHIWKLLSTSPFQAKPLPKQERTPLQLPYRRSSTSSEDSAAEISNLKVQAAILNMISDLAGNKRSASALEAVLKKVSGIVIGIVCSGVKGLQDACVNTLVGLASIDPDLIWLLLADVYYSRMENLPSPPSPEFPEITQVLPLPASLKEYLCMLYGGQTYGFDVDFTAVDTVLNKLYAQVFTSQMYK
ncbi:hypothetical protein Sango_2551500 [Sesamum angolense]|uniref:TTI1 C-terminal TPR domain-containing protein n=1 Tax=Sesamum angolense TaxID=2727404 RepID=A0AAE2BIQ4_9LAMI|nr:hypothetical protein Sango_2551500 [Sesamum angolense]